MRFANLLTEDEIYDQMVDALMDLVVVYVSKNEPEIDISTLLASLHSQNYDADKSFVITTLKSKPFVDKIANGVVYLKSSSEDDEAESNEETDKSADHVEKMAQRALGKAKSR